MTPPVLCLLVISADWAAADPDAIMARMAANLEAGTAERQRWIYQQKVQGSLIRANKELARRETRIYSVAPGKDRSEKTLVKLEGEHKREGKPVVRYAEAGYDPGGMNIDGELLDDLLDDLADDEESLDGIPHSLFPFRTKELQHFRFQYLGSSEVKGRLAHRIGFTPKRTKDCDGDCHPWKGEALVDAEEFQPVRVYTDLDFKMPWAVKAFLGTNIRQVGFNVTYQRVAPNVWFPLTYGSEFRVDVLWGYKRVITLALESFGFQRGGAESSITYQTELVP